MISRFASRTFAVGLTLGATVAATSVLTTVQPRLAHAADCTLAKSADDMTEAEVDALYSCMREKLTKAYGKGKVALGKEYAGWKAGAQRPAAPGPHGGRFLMTYVNDIGHADYVKYADENVKMPVGTIIAKESFKANKKGKVRVGPLFLMTKLEDGKAKKFGDWLYGGVKPNGKIMKVSQKFCHDCHKAFDDQDALGYPAEEVRLK